jgi:mannose-6-phosphate isomerase
MSVRLLEPKFVERVWGTTRLSPLFPDQDRKIGEVWFDAGASYPLLTKFLFTSERLSVQVHPGDAYGQKVENSRGKTEMWHILAAEPGATLAIGFRKPVPANALRAAIQNGTVEDLLNWIPAKAGDTFFIQAGVVHALGAGITLCEIQQNSDVTYRLYDYGRGRELHIDKGLEVLDRGEYESRRTYPLQCDHFTTDLLDLDASRELRMNGGILLIALEGSGSINSIEVQAGQVGLTTGDEAVRIQPHGHMKLLRTACPSG